ncbi:hypothetical protein PIB30_044889 [Stylosanthes scabra]|uniref:Uncharacterized protein n=1 Tax=Stylosanthes scabra TaxID=79078 RepID=A0ABU6TFN6_9FABA|nr:hypothetical protein [Stylosanthes scabra]
MVRSVAKEMQRKKREEDDKLAHNARRVGWKTEPPITPPFVLTGLVFAVADIASKHLCYLFFTLVSSRSTTVFAVTAVALPPSLLLPRRRVHSGWLLQECELLSLHLVNESSIS